MARKSKKIDAAEWRDMYGIDINELLKPKERYDVEDGIQMLKEANHALDMIGKKLEIMKKIAFYAADPKCDPVRRIELNLMFQGLKREIEEWANTRQNGVELLNYKPKPQKTPME